MAGSVSKKTKSKTEGVTVRKAVRSGAAAGKKKVAAKTRRKTVKPAASKATGKRSSKSGSTRQRESIIEEFRSVINIPREQLARWLNTTESQKLRFPDEPKNGKRSGEMILKILAKRQDKITSEDVDYMRTVIEFIAPRLQKRPKGDIVASNWRYSLMNWGHDPSKPRKRIRGVK